LIIFRKRIAGLSVSALNYFVLHARRLVGLRKTVNVLITSSAEMRSLNRQFRLVDKPTDVLSFPAAQIRGKQSNAGGDIVISGDIARDNAKQLGHAVSDEIKILVLHGLLHLAGHDHERDHGEMARKELRLRRTLKLEAGLIERTQAASGGNSNHRKPTLSTKAKKRPPSSRRRSA
jgi:probable rRNA maturation factor